MAFTTRIKTAETYNGEALQAVYPTITQSVTPGSGAALTITVGATVTMIRLFTTATTLFVKFGGTAATTANGMPVAANFPEYFTCNPGDTISAITSTGSATLFVTAASN